MVDAGEHGKIASFVAGVPFACVLPAAIAPLQGSTRALVNVLLKLGCHEFVCVGAEARHLEDALDEIVEDAGRMDVVTTAIEEAKEAAEYVLFAVGCLTSHVVLVDGECGVFPAELVKLGAVPRSSGGNEEGL
ncbi:hypothetical protein ABIA71_001781 [Stenotrophomonas sp. 2619]|uniref:hypothetical protein n=1 Tax=Stenotrophomonas sp. 2619 TaxID=3156316 RepID=UPI00339266B4